MKYLGLFMFLMMTAGCAEVSSIESDPRSDASQTSEFSTAPKDDNCCLKFSPSGKCLQERSAGCSAKENLNIKKPLANPQ